MSDSLQPCVCVCVARQAPYPWDSPSRNSEVDCHALLQGIFPSEELNPGLLNCSRLSTVWTTSEAPSDENGTQYIFVVLERVRAPELRCS